MAKDNSKPQGKNFQLTPLASAMLYGLFRGDLARIKAFVNGFEEWLVNCDEDSFNEILDGTGVLCYSLASCSDDRMMPYGGKTYAQMRQPFSGDPNSILANEISPLRIDGSAVPFCIDIPKLTFSIKENPVSEMLESVNSDLPIEISESHLLSSIVVGLSMHQYKLFANGIARELPILSFRAKTYTAFIIPCYLRVRGWFSNCNMWLNGRTSIYRNTLASQEPIIIEGSVDDVKSEDILRLTKGVYAKSPLNIQELHIWFREAIY